MKKILTISSMMLSLIIAGCGDSGMKEFKNGFIVSCTDGGTSKAVCSCSYDEMEDHYTEEQLTKFSEGIMPADFLDFAQKAALKCVKENS